MTHLLRCGVYVWVLAISPCLIAGGRVSAQELDPRLRKIQADWKKRQERIKTVRYRVEREGVAYKEGLVALGYYPKNKPPSKDMRSRGSFLLLLDFTTNRHRLEAQSSAFNITTHELSKVEEIITFDGKQLTGVQPWSGESVTKNKNAKGKADAAFTRNPAVLPHAPFKPDQWPCFASHGLVVTTDRDQDQIVPGKLNAEHDLSHLTVHGQAVLDGRPCLVLRTFPHKGTTTNFQEFWVDTGRDSALVRRREISDGTPRDDVQIEYQATTHGWLVRAWTRTGYLKTSAGRTMNLGYSRFRVTELRIDLPVTDADFQCQFRPGMLVRETTEITLPAPGGSPDEAGVRFYRVGADGTMREVVLEGGVERSRWWISPWWALAMVPAVGALLWWMSRRKARAQTTSGG